MDDTKIAVEQKYQFGEDKKVSSKERKKSIHSTATFTMKAPWMLHVSEQRNPFCSQHCHHEVASCLCGHA